MNKELGCNEDITSESNNLIKMWNQLLDTDDDANEDIFNVSESIVNEDGRKVSHEPLDDFDKFMTIDTDEKDNLEKEEVKRIEMNIKAVMLKDDWCKYASLNSYELGDAEKNERQQLLFYIMEEYCELTGHTYSLSNDLNKMKVRISCICRKKHKAGNKSKALGCPAALSLSKTGSLTFTDHTNDCKNQLKVEIKNKPLTASSSFSLFKRSIDRDTLRKFIEYLQELKNNGIYIRTRRIPTVLTLYMKSKSVL